MASHTDTKTPPPSRPRRVPKRMTLREFEAFDTNPDEKWELIEGVPCMTPTANAPHNKLAQVLANTIESILATTTGWYVVLDTSARFGDIKTEVRPDVAAFRQNEIKDPRVVPIRATPRLVIECLSPGNADYDLGDKFRVYRKAGIPEYWVVDPKTGAITLFVLRKGEYEQLVVDPKGFIESPLLKKKLRIVVKPWSFEILEA
ncbi:MAG: Uma2 family endonuclease [Planctomycetes bacterium]|nr:Uma2 family endonuclease [Planctomycetota bacterium]